MPVVDPEQVVNACRLILGRTPEDAGEIAAMAQEPDIERLGARLLRSGEFRRRAARAAITGASRQWVCAEIRHGLKLWVDLLDPGMSAGILQDNWERDETDFVLSVLRPGGVFVEIGANLGWFTILAAQAVGPGGHVHAFEPRADIAAKLAQTIEANAFSQRCTLHAVAPGPEAGLDSLPFDQPVHVLRMDVRVDGALVMRGASEFLTRHHPIILSGISGADPDGYLTLLKGHGYRAFQLASGRIGREIHSVPHDGSLDEANDFTIVALAAKDSGRLIDASMDQRVASLQAELDTLAVQAAAARRRSETLADAARHAEDAAARAEESLAALRQREADAVRQKNNLAEALAAARQQLQRLQTADAAPAAAVLAEALADAEAARLRLAELESSTAWRVTGPVRRASGKVPAPLRSAMARAARVAWWTASLQLPARLRQRKDRRMMALAAQTDAAPVIAIGGAQARTSVEPLALLDVGRPVALIIDALWPQPDKDAGSVEAVNMIEALLELGLDVIVTAEYDYAGTGLDSALVAALGARILGPEDAPSIRDFIETHGSTISLFVLTRVGAGGQYFELIRHNCADAKIMFFTVDLHFLREDRQARLNNDEDAIAAAGQTRDREEFLTHGSDVTVVVSPVERAILTASVPGAYIVDLPLSRADLPFPAPFGGRRGVCFIGGFAHQPNVDAVRYFLAEIWQLVLERLPDCQFTIIGAGLPDGLLQDAPEGVTYVGQQPDLDAWLSGSRLSVAPLRYGAGMKGKVVSSLAAGLPCVGTTLAFEGMSVAPRQDVLLADTPAEFAAAVVSAHEDPALWAALSANGQDYIRRENSMAAHRRRMHEMLITIGVPCITPG